METAVINLLWHPQAQFAGYLAAEHRDLGLTGGVRIKTTPIEFGTGPVKSVLTGESHFGVASPAHILETAPEDLCLLLIFQQDSPLVYPVRRDSGIGALSDLVGRRVAVWPGGEDLELRWMLSRAGVDPEAVDRVPTEDTVQPFVDGAVASAQLTLYNELYEVEEAGLRREQLRLFAPSEFDAALIKDGLICRRALAAERPAFVQAVVDAVMAGWAWALQNAREAVEICMASWPDLARERQEMQLADIRALTFVGATSRHGIGYPDPVHVDRAARALADLGESAAAVGREDIVDDRFWSAAPESSKIRA